MYYCENCMLLSHEDACPDCGNEGLKAPASDALCFLVEKEMIWSGMLMDVLGQKNIPYIYKPVLGAGLAMKAGPALERYRIYVPFSHFDAAQEIVEELFSKASEE